MLTENLQFDLCQERIAVVLNNPRLHTMLSQRAAEHDDPTGSVKWLAAGDGYQIPTWGVLPRKYKYRLVSVNPVDCGREIVYEISKND